MKESESLKFEEDLFRVDSWTRCQEGLQENGREETYRSVIGIGKSEKKVGGWR